MSANAQTQTISHTSIAVQLASLSALGPFCIDAYLPSLPDLAHSLGNSLEAVQSTLTAYMVPFALMTLWHGSLSDSLGRRRVVIWGLCIFLAACIGCTLAPSLGWLIAFRIIQGATAGVGMVVGRAIVRDLYQGPEAQKLMALVAIVFAIAPAISPIIGGWLHHFFGWRAIFAFMAVYTGGLVWLMSAKLPETLPPEKRQPFNAQYLFTAYKDCLRNPIFVNACLTITISFLGLFLYVLSAPKFLMDHLHVSETGFLWLFGPLTVGIVVGNGLSSRLAGRIPLLRTATIGCGVMLASTIANVAMNLLMAPALPWAILPLFFYMVGMSLVMPSLTIKAIDCFPEKRGLAASCQSFIQSSGSSVLSATAPLFWASSLSLSLTQLSYALLAAGLLYLLIRRHARTVGTQHAG